MYQDETLTCRDCGKEFVFTASEQAFYAEKGFQNKPRRSPQRERWQQWPPSDVRSDLRWLRLHHPGALPAPWRSPRVLPRLLR